jgi:hypothetical protein
MPEVTVGEIVHYVSHGTPVRPDGSQAYTPACRAAILTEVGAWITVGYIVPKSFALSEGRPIRSAEQWWFDDAVSLMVANPTGQFFNQGARHAPSLTGSGEDPAGGTWHALAECAGGN